MQFPLLYILKNKTIEELQERISFLEDQVTDFKSQVKKRDDYIRKLEDEAYQLVQLMESGKLTDVKAFWRDVHNELTFRGIASVESLSYEELIIALLSISD